MHLAVQLLPYVHVNFRGELGLSGRCNRCRPYLQTGKVPLTALDGAGPTKVVLSIRLPRCTAFAAVVLLEQLCGRDLSYHKLSTFCRVHARVLRTLQIRPGSCAHLRWFEVYASALHRPCAAESVIVSRALSNFIVRVMLKPVCVGKRLRSAAYARRYTWKRIMADPKPRYEVPQRLHRNWQA